MPNELPPLSARYHNRTTDINNSGMSASSRTAAHLKNRLQDRERQLLAVQAELATERADNAALRTREAEARELLESMYHPMGHILINPAWRERRRAWLSPPAQPAEPKQADGWVLAEERLPTESGEYEVFCPFDPDGRKYEPQQVCAFFNGEEFEAYGVTRWRIAPPTANVSAGIDWTQDGTPGFDEKVVRAAFGNRVAFTRDSNTGLLTLHGYMPQTMGETADVTLAVGALEQSCWIAARKTSPTVQAWEAAQKGGK